MGSKFARWMLHLLRSSCTTMKFIFLLVMALRHRLNQCWLIINDASWHLAEGNLIKSAQDITHYKVFNNYVYENTATSPKGQWVNRWWLPVPLVNNLSLLLNVILCLVNVQIDVTILWKNPIYWIISKCVGNWWPSYLALGISSHSAKYLAICFSSGPFN